MCPQRSVTVLLWTILVPGGTGMSSPASEDVRERVVVDVAAAASSGVCEAVGLDEPEDANEQRKELAWALLGAIPSKSSRQMGHDFASNLLRESCEPSIS